MIVVTLDGSFGNQLRLFIFAYIIAKEKNQDLLLDASSSYNAYFDSVNLNLSGIKYKSIIYKRIKGKYLKNEKKRIEYIDSEDKLHELFEEKSLDNNTWYCLLPMEKIYIPFKIERKDLYKKYQKDIQKMLFIPELNYLKEKLVKDNNIKVAVHIRRKSLQPMRGNIYVTEESENLYFKAAIEYYREKFKNVSFYIFSDELEDVKKFSTCAVGK